MRSHTVYRTFTMKQRRQFVRITDDVAAAVHESGVQEGIVLVSALHVSAGVWVSDDEPGILADALAWLDTLAPETMPGEAHFKNLLAHHQVVLPITAGQLDLGQSQAVFYCEFDGGQPKRLVMKVLGE